MALCHSSLIIYVRRGLNGKGWSGPLMHRNAGRCFIAFPVSISCRHPCAAGFSLIFFQTDFLLTSFVIIIMPTTFCFANGLLLVFSLPQCVFLLFLANGLFNGFFVVFLLLRAYQRSSLSYQQSSFSYQRSSPSYQRPSSFQRLSSSSSSSQIEFVCLIWV